MLRHFAIRKPKIIIMVNASDIRRVLAEILDPEMPINLVDLGIIDAVRVIGLTDETLAAEIDVTPTFVGCPALTMIESEIRRRVGELPGIEQVTVKFVHAPPWSVDRISAAGRSALKRFGVTVPERGTTGACGSISPAGAAGAKAGGLVPLTISPPAAVPCPFCGSESTELESPFGPTRCKMIYYCPACRNSFEHLKRV